MSRVINPDSAGKERTQMIRAIVLAMRELMRLPETNDTARDLAAFIALTLDATWETVDPSVQAWEKRGYWLKADRFRMDWMWAQKFGGVMRKAVLNDDWATIAATLVQIGEKISNVKLPERHRLGTPWVGAWKVLKSQS